MKWTRALCDGLVVALLVAGCGTTTSTSVDPEDPAGADLPAGVPPNASRVEWRQIDEVTTPISLVQDRRRLVIRNATEWSDFWSELQGAVVPTPQPPAVDFTRQVVVAATMGQQPSSGYAIEFADVFEADGTLFPVVVETSPAAGCVLTPVVTAPAVAVLIDRADLEISFVEERRTADCR